MKFGETLLPEFDQEIANTRKPLERMPEDRVSWQPHKKSWSMIRLATHIANLLTWAVYIVQEDSLDIAPPGKPPLQIAPTGSGTELMAMFEKNVKAARAAIAGASDQHMIPPMEGKYLSRRQRLRR